MAADGPTIALEDYQRNELVEASNRLRPSDRGCGHVRLDAGRDRRVDGYTADRVLRICTDAGISET
jgi:hypothetical protein